MSDDEPSRPATRREVNATTTSSVSVMLSTIATRQRADNAHRASSRRQISVGNSALLRTVQPTYILNNCHSIQRAYQLAHPGDVAHHCTAATAATASATVAGIRRLQLNEQFACDTVLEEIALHTYYSAYLIHLHN